MTISAFFVVHCSSDLRLPSGELRFLAARATTGTCGFQPVTGPFGHQRMLELGNRTKNVEEHPPQRCRVVNALVENHKIDTSSVELFRERYEMNGSKDRPSRSSLVTTN